MAELRGSVIGELSGKLGNLAARIVNGRTILAQRPTSYKTNNAPYMVEIRQKFKVSGIFAKNVITLSALYQVWNKVKKARLSAYNEICKLNYFESAADKPTVDNVLTPEGGFPLPVTVAAVAAVNVTATLAALDTVMIASEEERDFVSNGLICYYNPVNPEDAPYAITKIESAPDSLDTVNPIELNIPLNVVQQNLAAKYQNSILYLVLATLDGDGKVIQYSSTYAKDSQ